MRVRSITSFAAATLFLLIAANFQATAEVKAKPPKPKRNKTTEKIYSNSQWDSAVLIDINFPIPKGTNRDVTGVTEKFLVDLPLIANASVRFHHCVLATFPVNDTRLTTTPSNQSFEYRLHFDIGARADSDLARMQAKIHRYAKTRTKSRDPIQRDSNLQPPPHLFTMCGPNINLNSPIVHVSLRNIDEQPDWYNMVEKTALPWFRNKGGLLIVTNDYGNRRKQTVRVVLYDLNTKPPTKISTIESENGFGDVSQELAVNLSATVKHWLSLCEYTKRKFSCYFTGKNLQTCRQRVLRHPKLNKSDPYWQYCMKGESFEATSKCVNVTACHRKCKAFEKFGVCNATCESPSDRKVFVHRPGNESQMLENCPRYQKPKFERCYAECAGELWAIAVMCVGIFLFVLLIGGGGFGVWFLFLRRAPSRSGRQRRFGKVQRQTFAGGSVGKIWVPAIPAATKSGREASQRAGGSVHGAPAPASTPSHPGTSAKSTKIVK